MRWVTGPPRVRNRRVYKLRGVRMHRSLIVASIVVAAALNPASAQPVTETIDLQTGWNAVWVNLDPQPNTLNEILAAQSPVLDYQAFWTFEANTSPSIAINGGTNGRWFFHDRDIPPDLSTLRVLYGHRAYLIHMRSAGQLRLTGRPLVRSTRFTSLSANLFGALTDNSAGPLSFEEYFFHPKSAGKVRTSGTPSAHDLFGLLGDTLVRKNLTDAIGSNEAYWVNVVQDFEYPGPLDLTSASNGIAFGRNTSLRTLSIEVPSSPSARTLTISALSCTALSPGAACSASGDNVDWLEFKVSGPLDPPIWQPLAAGAAIVVPPGATRVELDLRARRAALTTAARHRRGGTSTATFPLVINVTDGLGSRTVLAASVSIEPVFGRWVGRALLTHVSAHPIIQTIPLGQAEAPPLSMTLLLDLPDPSAAGTTPRLLDFASVDSFLDGRSIVKTYSSVLFDRPVDLAPDAGDPLDPFGGTGTLHGTIHILPDDPLNPYRHRYNPEHRRGYDITRQITIKLEPTPPNAADLLAGLDGTFGPHRLTGRYTEVITGITENPITVQGFLQLERLSSSPGSLAAR